MRQGVIAAAIVLAAAMSRAAVALATAAPVPPDEPGVRCIETAISDPQVALPMAAWKRAEG